MFNGDGTDAYRRGQANDKQVTGRVVIIPFKNFGPALLNGLQLGGSFLYSNPDTSDFKINIKTPAQTTFFSVAAQTKFNVLQDIGKLHGMNFDVAYTYGPFAITGEFFKNNYTRLKYTDTEPFNFSLRAWYVNMFYMLTGEHPVFKNGLLQGITPKYNFDVRQCRWGALGIGFQYQQFSGSPIVYSYLVEPGDSVRRATSFTVALNWYLNQLMRISLDYSRTWFSQPLYYGTDPEGIAYYDDMENAWVTRFQLASDEAIIKRGLYEKENDCSEHVLLAICSNGADAAYFHMGEADAPKFQQAYPDLKDSKLDSCTLCHQGGSYVDTGNKTRTLGTCQWCHYTYGYDASGDITKTINPYGKDYLNAGRSVSAFASIESKDSDGDTYTNKAGDCSSRFSR